MEVLAQILAILNDTALKGMGALVIGFVMKRAPKIVNKSIPVWLHALSAILAAGAAWFPAATPDAVPGSFVYSSFAGYDFYAAASPALKVGSWLWNTLVPVGLAMYLHTTGKNTIEWARMGFKFVMEPPKK